MSLSALAIRLATIRAIKGRTFAEDRVFDSAIHPVDLVAVEHSQPVVIVTTDDDDVTVEGRDLMAADHRLELVIEVAVASKLTVDGDGDPKAVMTIPATDAGLEATLNLIGWQVLRALTADGGEWGDLWRQLVMRVHEIQCRRGADETNGVRFAARQYILKVDHIAEPSPGMDPVGVWERTIGLLKEDAELASIGRIIEATVAADPLEPWERVRAALGLADDVSGWIADRPFEDGAALAGIDLTDGFSVDANTSADADGPEDAA